MGVKRKSVLITGASSGIGEASAKLFAASGARLLLCARRVSRLEALAERIRQAHDTDIYTFQLDVRDRTQVENALSELPDAWQDIDILVNNAGLARGFESLATGSPEDWDEMLDTNVKGLLYVTRTVLPKMLVRGSGHIINIGSVAGHEAYAGGTVYCASKSAVRSITAGLKKDLHGTPIRVSTVDPGATETEFSLIRFHGDEAKANPVYEGMTPLTAEDIAEAVYFCASRPAHVNIAEMLLFSTDQSSATMIHRR